MITSIWRILLVFWLLSVLVVISLPWSKFDGIPHWDAIQWLPFTDFGTHPTELVEFAANILAFMPVGYLLVRSLPLGVGHPLLLATALGFCSSALVESYQLFCNDRVPSSTDLLTNTGGTVFGAWVALRVDQLLSVSFVRLRRLS